MVLLAARSRGHILRQGALRRSDDARMGPGPQGTEDVQIKRKRDRALGDHRPGGRRFAQAVPDQIQRPLGGHVVPEGRPEERQKDTQHLLERGKLRIYIHEPGRLRAREIYSRIHTQKPQTRGPVDAVPHRAHEARRDRGIGSEGAPQGRPFPGGLHNGGPLQMVRPSCEGQDVDRGRGLREGQERLVLHFALCDHEHGHRPRPHSAAHLRRGVPSHGRHQAHRPHGGLARIRRVAHRRGARAQHGAHTEHCGDNCL